MKTIFITITRGPIVRNILRCGVLDYLKKAGFNIVIFFPKFLGKEIPEYLRKEFEDGQVKIEGVEHDLKVKGILGKIYRRFFISGVKLLTFNHHTLIYRLLNKKGSRRVEEGMAPYLEAVIYAPLSKLNFLKKLVRVIEQKIFTHNFFGEYFDKYQPCLVFSTSINAQFDMLFMKEARARGIKTVSMTKGWDTAIKLLFRFIPDTLMVQNEIMREIIHEKQGITKKQMEIIGFPHFDWYVNKEILLDRNEYIRSLGLDPAKKLIFFGSAGKWMPNDDKIAETVIKFMKENKLAEPCSLLIRSHFSNIKENKFVRFEDIEDVAVDKNITISDFFLDSWDPSKEEFRKFINLLHHCDLLVTFGSTLNLDVACFNKPIINVAFDVLRVGNKDVSYLAYQNHLKWVTDTGAVDLVFSEAELLDSINRNLKNPTHKQEERQKMVNTLCHLVDGKSSERAVEVILKTIRI